MQVADTFTFMDQIATSGTPAPPVPAEPPAIGPSLRKVAKFTPRKLAESVLSVFERLGGEAWLLSQARTDPQAFMKVLIKILPTNISLDGLDQLNVTLIDQYGNECKISAEGQTAPHQAPRTVHPHEGASGSSAPTPLPAAGGLPVTPTPASISPEAEACVDVVDIVEEYPATPAPGSATGGTLTEG